MRHSFCYKDGLNNNIIGPGYVCEYKPIIMQGLNKYLLLSLFMVFLFFTGCEKEIEPKDPDTEVPADVSMFIWNNMFEWYLWYENVPNLSPAIFPSTDDWYRYLNSFGTDYESLFNSLLYQYGVIDKWSWIVDDYIALENSFAGISKSMGFDFRLMFIYSNSNELFGYVRYVLPGSPADNAGLRRGDLFTEIDGQQLTDANYRALLINSESYTMGLADFNEQAVEFTANGVTKSMVAVELQENPVHYSSVIDVGGVSTAYLVYNAFTADFELELNDVFGDFNSQGVQRLILDLRYNSGGSINTAVYLASMIYGTATNDLFIEYQYNNKIQDYIISDPGLGYDFIRKKFADRIDTTTVYHSNPPTLPFINSLNLSELYVITTRGTASASELVMNGLYPYMDVKQVGDTTSGKYVGSLTLYDYTDYPIRNPNHTWALQPIVLKVANSVGTSDFVDGLIPDISTEEDVVNLLPLGDVNEPLLKATIDYILGLKSFQAIQTFDHDFRPFKDSKDFIPHSKEMYLDPKFNLNKLPE